MVNVSVDIQTELASLMSEWGELTVDRVIEWAKGNRTSAIYKSFPTREQAWERHCHALVGGYIRAYCKIISTEGDEPIRAYCFPVTGESADDAGHVARPTVEILSDEARRACLICDMIQRAISQFTQVPLRETDYIVEYLRDQLQRFLAQCTPKKKDAA